MVKSVIYFQDEWQRNQVKVNRIRRRNQRFQYEKWVKKGIIEMTLKRINEIPQLYIIDIQHYTYIISIISIISLKNMDT